VEEFDGDTERLLTVDVDVVAVVLIVAAAVQNRHARFFGVGDGLIEILHLETEMLDAFTVLVEEEFQEVSLPTGSISSITTCPSLKKASFAWPPEGLPRNCTLTSWPGRVVAIFGTSMPRTAAQR